MPWGMRQYIMVRPEVPAVSPTSALMVLEYPQHENIYLRGSSRSTQGVRE